MLIYHLHGEPHAMSGAEWALVAIAVVVITAALFCIDHISRQWMRDE